MIGTWVPVDPELCTSVRYHDAGLTPEWLGRYGLGPTSTLVTCSGSVQHAT